MHVHVIYKELALHIFTHAKADPPSTFEFFFLLRFVFKNFDCIKRINIWIAINMQCLLYEFYYFYTTFTAKAQGMCAGA